ncbi:cysteine hydrolase family protein [Meiothermus granaticius]|uniref:Peroxyureidoacrylate/ureidoacrylate amidohydrolase RutB n=1 Tax=Meiothermus granaticius NBRC 107808 TaxID=1227551 RepID=A0A399FFK6_9DEIN|nr:isochorismatase family cysteine hydrolase [Meiothermus granaticius]MCL6527186.1 cysteine hydrolase [Thermaceae bacterium]RIH93961.1 Peroxyureidoacrylate/ureidoacrylate amidohydrolase RutB [Meiothermus granaticius NBRC 107808]GEM87793.1 isochorismatase [Meiothermus granaticius NBRC 107808]
MLEIPEIPRQSEIRLPAQETAVIVVDMQNDFVEPEGALFVPEAPATVANIQRLLERARVAGVKIVYTQDWHPEGDPEFTIWPRHAVQGTWGAQIIAPLKPRPEDTVLQKVRYDGFYGTPLEHLLHLWGIQHVVIVGTVANICVLHTAGSAALRWYKVVLPEDGTSALTPFDQESTLRQVTFLYLGQVTTCDGVRFE